MPLIVVLSLTASLLLPSTTTTLYNSKYEDTVYGSTGSPKIFMTANQELVLWLRRVLEKSVS